MFLRETERLALVDFDDTQINYKELIRNVKYFSENIIELGENNFGLIIMENRKEWIYSFFAIWDRKSAPITLDSHSNNKEILYVLEDSNPNLIICSNETENNVLEAISEYKFKENIKIINVDKINIDENKLNELRNKKVILKNPENDNTALMLYTSGTTGAPKGVMLTYGNLNSQIDGIFAKGIFTEEDQILAILPFHHILPLTATILLMFREQTSVVLVKKIASKEILEALEKNRVTAIIGVPRVFKLFYDGIKQQIDAKFITRFIYKIMQNVKSFKLKKIIFKKIHEKFGGHLDFIVSGGAKLDVEIAKFYETVGYYSLEGYGLTETSPVIAVNSKKERKIGTVGKKLENVDIKLVDEELWVKGPIVMKGYYNKPDKTAEVITEDGWFKTGDLAQIDEEGYVTILGRKNSMIVLSNGKNIDPETLENKVVAKSNYLVKEIGIFGYNDKLVAIIVPEITEFRKRGITNIKAYIQNIVEDYNLSVHNHEKILNYKLTEEELPKTRVGKTRRFMLPDLYENNNVKKEKIEEPDTEIYKLLKSYVKRQKGIEPLPNENLELEIGMDSLDLVEFFAYIENSFGIKMTEDLFSEISNLKLLSEYIEEKALKIEETEVNWKEIIENTPANLEEKNRFMTKILKYVLDIIINGYFRLKKINRNKITNEPQIFISNHQSFIDALVLGSLLPTKVLYKTMFLAIDWYFKNNFMKLFVDHGNVVLIDINKDIRKSVEEIAAHIKGGRNVLIFPEGARTKDGKVASFKKVFAIIAKELNVEIQCLGIKGAFEAYSRYMKIPRPKKIEVATLEKFKPEGTYEEIVEKAEKIIKEFVEKK